MSANNPLEIVCVLLKRSGCKSNLQEEDSDRFKALAECFLRFTPDVALRGNEAIFLNLKGCHKYSEIGLKLRAISLVNQFFPYAQPVVRFSSKPSVALSLCFYPSVQSKDELPIESLLYFQDPFSSRIYIHDFARVISYLNKLGIKTLKDFERVSTSSITSRFGKSFLLMKQSLMEEFEETWPIFLPNEKILEKRGLEWEVDHTGVFFVLKETLDRVFTRLRGLSKRLSKIEIVFKIKKDSTVTPGEGIRKWHIEFPVPQGSTLSVIPIIRDRILFDLQKRQLQSYVHEVEVSVLETVPGKSLQLNFFNKKEEDQENWNALLGRILSQIGQENVFFASYVDRYLPEKAWEKSISIEKLKDFPDKGVFSDRPLQLFKRPKPVQIQGRELFFERKKHSIIRWIGPEKIETEWWDDSQFNGASRDYYKLILDEGQIFWIFLDRQFRRYYLHGIFD